MCVVFCFNDVATTEGYTFWNTLALHVALPISRGSARWPMVSPSSSATRPKRRAMAELSDLELLAELGVDTAPEPVRTLTPLQERIIAGFEDIQRFVKENGRLPQHGEDRDIDRKSKRLNSSH